jgi:hypothetical protein
MSWEEHVKELTTKLNKACYAIRLIKPIISLKILITIYFCYVRSAISYGIIFWGNSYHSKGIFTIQKRIIRVIINMNKRDSCHEIFKQLNILPLSHSIYSPSSSLLVKIENCLDLIQRYMILVQDITLIPIYLQLP